MKKQVKNNWVLAVILIIVVVAIAYIVYNYYNKGVLFSPGNYVYNPGFNGSSGWNFGYEYGNGTVSILNNQLRIAGYGFALQNVLNNSMGRTYRLSFDALNNGANAAVYIQELPSWQARVVVKPTANYWKRYSVIFTVPTNNQYMVTLATEGNNRRKSTSVLYDNVVLEDSIPETSCYWSPDPTDANRILRGTNNQLMNMTTYTEERLLCYNGRWYAATDSWSYWDYTNSRIGYTDNNKKYWGIIIPSINAIVGNWKIVNDPYWGMKWTKNVVNNNCVDNDVNVTYPDGRNLFQKGTVTIAGGSYTDSCYNDTAVHEWWCTGTTSMSGNNYNCPSGYKCNDGSCIYNNLIKLQSDFLKNDIVAIKIANGENYTLNISKLWTGDYVSYNYSSFEFKLFNAIKYTGFSNLFLGYGGSWDGLVSLVNRYRTLHNITSKNYLDSETLILLDKEIKEREDIDKKKTINYPAFVKFISAPKNEPAREHFAMILSSFLQALPNSTKINDPIWTVKELERSLANGMGGNLGLATDLNMTRELSFQELLNLIYQNNTNFMFCPKFYYGQYWGSGNCIQSLNFNNNLAIMQDDFGFMGTFIHEYGHEVGFRTFLNLSNGKQGYASSLFGNISFYKSGNSWFWIRPINNTGEFVSGYARTGPSNNLNSTTYPYPEYDIPSEDFAESFISYITEGKIFRERAKTNSYLMEKYLFLKQYIFNNTEYDTGSINNYNLWTSQNTGIPFHTSDYDTQNPLWRWDYQYPLK